MTIRRTLACGVVLAALALSACVPQAAGRRPPTVTEAASLKAVTAAGQGLVVASMTVENLDLRRRARIAIPILSISGKTKGDIVGVLRISNGIPRRDSRTSDFADVYGRLFSTALAAGRYRLQPWVVYDKEMYVAMDKTTAWEFTIKAGEVVYLGSYHFGLFDGFHFFTEAIGAPNIGGVRFELKDRAERDFQLLRTRYPEIALDSIRRADPKALAWATAQQITGHNDRAGWLGVLGGFAPRAGGALSALDILAAVLAFLLGGVLRRSSEHYQGRRRRREKCVNRP